MFVKMDAFEVKKELQRSANPEKAKLLQRFFKTGPGQYGEGDIFIGVTVPILRQVAKKFRDLAIEKVELLLQSAIHEDRLVALLILIHKYSGVSGKEKEGIVKFYLDNLKQVNNWDLVDLTAPTILGAHLKGSSRKMLYRLAGSDIVWERRAAIVSTLHFIRNNDFEDTLKIAEMLLSDQHDLIHKAVGWMLREVGKRDVAALETFLDKHCGIMPRTTLRYAIERLSDKKKRRYLKTARLPLD